MQSVRSVMCFGTGWLMLEGVQLPIEQEHGLGLVFVVVREGVVALGKVETEHHKGQGAHEVLLEGDLGQLGALHIA